MNGGSLRHTALYQEPTSTLDSLGQEPEPTWTTIRTLRCAVRTPNGRESLFAQQIQATADHVVTHRFAIALPSVLGRYVLEDGRVFQIVSSSDQDERRRTVVSLCIEVKQPSS